MTTLNLPRGIATSMRLQVVLARVDDADALVGGAARARRLEQRLQRRALLDRAPSKPSAGRSRAAPSPVCDVGVALHVLRRAGGDQLAAGVAAFGAEVDQPVGGADHVEVVLDDDERVARFEQLAERAHQLGDVVEVQAGGRLVEHEQRALLRQRAGALPRGSAPLRRGSRRASGAAPRRPRASAPAGRAARTRGRRRRSAAAARTTSRSSRRTRTASATVRSSTSATESCATRRRHAALDLDVEDLGAEARPSQSGQRRYTSERNCISTCSKPEPPQVGQRPLPALKLNMPAP